MCYTIVSIILKSKDGAVYKKQEDIYYFYILLQSFK